MRRFAFLVAACLALLPAGGALAVQPDEILADPAMRQRLDSYAFVATESVPQAGLADWVRGEYARWTPVVRASGATG